jgi:uncharacterized membrane protein
MTQTRNILKPGTTAKLVHITESATTETLRGQRSIATICGRKVMGYVMETGEVTCPKCLRLN